MEDAGIAEGDNKVCNIAASPHRGETDAFKDTDTGGLPGVQESGMHQMQHCVAHWVHMRGVQGGSSLHYASSIHI